MKKLVPSRLLAPLLFIGGALVVFALLYARVLPASASAHQDHTGCTLIWTSSANEGLYLCPPGAIPGHTATPGTPGPTGTVSAATATTRPTLTPVPGPTGTPLPTVTPEPGPTQIGDVDPYPNAPACMGHNRRAFHTLWNAFEGCHHTHQHGDNPHAVDDILNPLAIAETGKTIYQWMGADLGPEGTAEISHPWQTFSDAGLENDLKHAGYAWHVRRDIPCAGVPSPCITAFRTLVHQHASGRDATVRYHSYVFEAATSDGGYIMYNGWADFGDLHIPEGNIVVNVPDNHDSNGGCTGAGRHKQHGPGGDPQIIWYGASQQVHGACGPRGFITLSVSVHDVWDYTSQTSPAAFEDYVCYPAPNCQANGTSYRAHLISVNMITRFAFIYDATGRANWTGYADRYGLPRTDGICTEPSVDCAPVIFRNLRRNYNYQTANAATANLRIDHDIYFCGQQVCGARDRDSVTSGWSQPVP